jgi:hypothetical protein
MTNLKARAIRERAARNLCYYLDTKASNFVWFLRHPITWLKCMGWVKHRPSIRA